MEDKERQDRDFEWYENNLALLYSQYGHAFLAIQDKRVIGVYRTYADGVRETSKKNRIGTFIVQECVKDRSDMKAAIFWPSGV